MEETVLNTFAESFDVSYAEAKELTLPVNINTIDEDGNSLLHNVIEKKLWDIVCLLLKQGVDVNLKDNMFETPLHRAAKYTDLPSWILYLLTTPENINTQDIGGSTALHLAARYKAWDTLLLLIQNGADIDIKDTRNLIPLHIAVTHKDIPQDVLIQLISPDNIVAHERNGFTALHRAVVRQCWDSVPTLVQHGAVVNAMDKFGCTPLHRAVPYKHVPEEVLTQLMSPTTNNCWAHKGETALHEAINAHSWKNVSILVKHGVDVNITDKTGCTPIHTAMKCRNVPNEVVGHLISTTNINMKHSNGATALHDAVANKIWAVLTLLIQQGADVNSQNINLIGNTPLVTALIHPDTPQRVIQQLMSPQNIDMQSDTGYTPLHTAVCSKRWDLIHLLVKQGCDVNKVLALENGTVYTALHMAIAQGSVPKEAVSQIMPGDPIHAYSIIIEFITGSYDREHLPGVLECLLQHLPGPLYIRSLELHRFSIQLNRNHFDFHTKLFNSVTGRHNNKLDMIFFLLNETCWFMNVQFGKEGESIDDDYINYLCAKYEELRACHSSAASLTQQSMFAVRRAMVCKSSEAFSQLGIPHLLPKVTFKYVACKLCHMWDNN